MENILEWDPDHLVYDPHPELDNWRGTASPPIDHPLVRSPERWKIAGRVWWNGPRGWMVDPVWVCKIWTAPRQSTGSPVRTHAPGSIDSISPWSLAWFWRSSQSPVAPATQTKAPLRRAVIAGSDSILFSHDWKFVPRAIILCRPTDSPTVGDGFQHEIFYGL